MRFVKVPDRLPAPQAYLRAGIPRPNQTGPGRHRTDHDDSGDHADSVTTTDEHGQPETLTWHRSDLYLSRPVPRQWTPHYRTEVIDRAPSGALRMRQHGPQTEPMHQPADRSDLGTCRVVTFDRSVYLAGLDPAKMAPHDAIFLSAALYLDAAATLSEGPGDQLGTRYDDWDLTEPVPLDSYVIRIYCEIAGGDAQPLRRTDPPPIDRVDLLCAATAILYSAPLYTTNPEQYTGIGTGLKTIDYGPLRNRRHADKKPWG